MRQVPHYLIVGNGRVAKQVKHYFSLSHISFSTWNRAESISTLNQKSQEATHILLLISDGAIDDFAKKHFTNCKATLIHFSGSLVSDIVFGAHPLMTFSSELYSLEQYHAIPFVIDENAPDFASLLPGFSNKHVRINKSQKAKYHALCVLAGNFSCLLWQALFKTFVDEFNIPQETAYPYLKQQMQNLISDADTALTGPLVRNDKETIKRNITALQGDPLQALYQCFINYYNNQSNER